MMNRQLFLMMLMQFIPPSKLPCLQNINSIYTYTFQCLLLKMSKFAFQIYFFLSNNINHNHNGHGLS
jgi:hypothetical protein